MSDNSLITLNGDGLQTEVSPRPSYAQRIQRAHELSKQCTSASELLSFYARLASLQERVFEWLSSNALNNESEHAGSWLLNADQLAPMFPEFLRSLAEISPAPVRDRAGYFARSNASEQGDLLTGFWEGTSGAISEDEVTIFANRFVALAFLQPYAEWLAQSHHANSFPAHSATCTICSSEPVCAVLRDQYHGARRGLICSLCMHEWSFPRLKCPTCGEERFEALPIFTPEVPSHVRVDACDTCKRYIKTVDLTKDGNAVAVVDELATAPLDLWARDQGYTKLTLNIAGL